MPLKNINKILIINLGGIGDILLSLPSLKAIHEAYPRASIDIVVVERARELAADSGVFSNVFIYNKNIISGLKLFLTLHKANYDLAVNMRTIVSLAGALKMLLFVSIVHPKIGAGRNTDGHGFFFDIKIPESLHGDKHESEYDMDLARAIGADVKDKTIRFDIPEDIAHKTKKILLDNGIKDTDTIVGINAGGMPSHRWPVENFEAVIKKIDDYRPSKFILTGDIKEKKYVDVLVKAIPDRVLNLSGALTMQELAAVIKRCDLYISNDTGPMHIAAALKIPLIAIFGPGYVKRFDPRHISETAVVLYKEVPCAPCDRFFCRSSICLKNITVQNVVDEAIRILGRLK